MKSMNTVRQLLDNWLRVDAQIKERQSKILAAGLDREALQFYQTRFTALIKGFSEALGAVDSQIPPLDREWLDRDLEELMQPFLENKEASR